MNISRLLLKKLVVPQPYNRSIEFPDDVCALRNALNSLGFDASDSIIAEAWDNYSSSMCAGWLDIDKIPKVSAEFLIKQKFLVLE